MLERAKFNMPFRVHVAMHFASGSQCVNIVRRQWNEHWENGTELQFCHNIIEYEICVNVFRVQSVSNISQLLGANDPPILKPETF